MNEERMPRGIRSSTFVVRVREPGLPTYWPPQVSTPVTSTAISRPLGAV